MSKPLDNWTSGSGRHLDELMKHVLDLNDGTMEFTLIHYAKSENPLYERVRELLIPRNPLSASKIIAKQRFDIVHYSPLSVYAPLWGVTAKKTATIHGIEEVLYPQGYSFIQRFHDTKIQPLLMKKMDGIATVSETGKRYFTEHYHIDPEKICITTNGLSPKYRTLPESERRNILNEKPGQKYILHLSRCSARKNPVTIFRGFSRFIQETGSSCLLVCAGRGWDGAEAKQLAAEAGIAEQYRAPGFVSEEDSVQLLNGAEAFVFPSFAEGFGMPNIEAMACGCPVLTSGIFAIPEVVGDAAYIISRPDSVEDFAAGLRKITEDSAYRRRLIERGLANIRRFNWDDSARNIIGYWKKLRDS
ncbi:MAG: glycosyltransferase family 4 protein [Spirochaetaceae bacterium]|jgi:glycosyltransferase involved in cell wall biosynthesis|nr:glycosyltransferase family 4 protein [Spirochaetaceae bacterium]